MRSFRRLHYAFLLCRKKNQITLSYILHEKKGMQQLEKLLIKSNQA